MKTIEIFDPAMCCETGVCGTSINPELLRVATLIDSLRKQGASIVRHGLANEPQAFVSNAKIGELLKQDENILPVTLVDGEVVKTKEYLTNKEFADYTGLTVTETKTEQTGCCCSGEEGCC